MSYSITLTGGSQNGPNSNATTADNLSNFSVSVWLKYSSTATRAIVAKTPYLFSNTPGWGLFVDSPNTNIFFRINNTVSAYDVSTGTNNPADGTWHNIIGTYDSVAGSHIYLDGTDVTTFVSGSAGGNYSNPNTFAIGDISANNLSYAGEMVDLQIWNVTLTSVQAASIAAAGIINTGLIAHWRMQEGSGALLNDSTGNGNLITFNTTPTWTTDTPAGIPPPLTNPKKNASMFLVF